jgi:hypothetical protein
VRQLVRDIHGGSVGTEKDDSDHGITPEEITRESSESDGSPESEVPSEAPEARRKRWQPKRVFRTCVATMRNVHGFGPLLAAEAQRRGFYQAKRKAFIGDGQEANWIVHRLHFPDFTAITDFMHAVGYAHAAAQATTTDATQEPTWPRYLRYAAACWQGRVHEVIAELDARLKQHPFGVLPKS